MKAEEKHQQLPPEQRAILQQGGKLMACFCCSSPSLGAGNHLH